MEFLDTLRSRHSIRSFSTEDVPREALERMFRAAALAPSAMNEQPWQFYVATGETRRTVLETMAQSTNYLEEYLNVLGKAATEDHLRWYSEFGGAPVIIACTMPHAEDEFSELNMHLAIGAAIQNLLLAAADDGVGTCNVTFSFWVRDELSQVFGIPDDRVIVALVVAGYPAEDPPIAPPHSADVAVYRD